MGRFFRHSVYENSVDEGKFLSVFDRATALSVRSRPIEQPCPRFAHQIVYDYERKVHYMFGGNPGPGKGPKDYRLDDFWRLTLHKPTTESIIKSCKWKLRRLNYEELAAASPMEALQYLREKIAEVVDFGSRVERREVLLLLSKFRNSKKKVLIFSV